MYKYSKYMIIPIAVILILILILNIMDFVCVDTETYLIKKKNHNYPKERLPQSGSRVKRRT